MTRKLTDEQRARKNARQSEWRAANRDRCAGYERKYRDAAKRDPVEPPCERYCARCEQTKPIAAFPRDKGKRGGFRYTCRECNYGPEDRARRKAYYWANREDAIAKAADWASQNHDKCNAAGRAWSKRNKPRNAAYARLYRTRNPEKAALSSAKRTIAQATGLSCHDIPDGLVTAKASQLAIFREIKKRES